MKYMLMKNKYILSLFKKYMRHVEDEQGTTFVEYVNSACTDVAFTKEEVDVLESIETDMYCQKNMENDL